MFLSDVVPCSSVTCLNGGVCSDTSSGFSCSCKPGYTGTTCETGTSQQQVGGWKEIWYDARVTPLGQYDLYQL